MQCISNALNLFCLRNKFALAKHVHLYELIRYRLARATTEILAENFVPEQQLCNKGGSFFLHPVQL